MEWLYVKNFKNKHTGEQKQMKAEIVITDIYEPMCLMLLQKIATELSSQNIELAVEVRPFTSSTIRNTENIPNAIATISEASAHAHIPNAVLSIQIPSFHGAITLDGDQKKEMSVCVQHLLSLGHESIAFISGPGEIFGNTGRRTAFAQVTSEINKVAEANGTGIVLRTKIVETDHAPEAVANVARILLQQGYTSFICSSDLLAGGIIHEAAKEGLHIPEDLSIIGYGDVPESSMLLPALTTIRLPYVRISKAITQIIQEIASTGTTDIRSLSFRSEFIVRQSTGQARKIRSSSVPAPTL
jgi:DNA-binding LacI/PurR family transcriptional regulator